MSMNKVKVNKKICMVGDPSVGKTSLIRKFVYDMFDDKYLITLGAKVTKKIIEIPKEGQNIEMKLMVWDISGQKTFGEIRSAYYRGSEGAFLVCDVTRKHTLTSLENWIISLYKVTEEIPIVIIANKVDLKENIEFGVEELKKVASSYKNSYFFTSAKTGEKVEESFQELGKILIKDM